MKGVLKSFPLALRLIFRDPVNLFLVIIPTLIAFCLYIIVISFILKNSAYYGVMLSNYVRDQESATILGKTITVLLILFVFLIMSWTYVFVVGLIAAPFNTLLSSRIEKLLVHAPVDENKDKALREVWNSIALTFKNEFKKLKFILSGLVLAFLLNLFPLFYPIGILILSVLLAVQFIDYSWSRHNLSWDACLKDVLRNIFSYAIAGFFFLLLVTVPIINAFVPALATSYFTVLWLNQQKKIKMT
ncbi:MAG: EI24 domain-containing protein [Bacteriovoracaceae bacterium]